MTTQRLSTQMLDILALLNKKDGLPEDDIVGSLPVVTGLFGGDFTPSNLYHKRYASVSRSLHRLQRLNLIILDRSFLRNNLFSRGYHISRKWYLTDKGKLTVKQRNLTDRVFETIKPDLYNYDLANKRSVPVPCPVNLELEKKFEKFKQDWNKEIEDFRNKMYSAKDSETNQ
jgi:hypothetical protein